MLYSGSPGWQQSDASVDCVLHQRFCPEPSAVPIRQLPLPLMQPTRDGGGGRSTLPSIELGLGVVDSEERHRRDRGQARRNESD